jgi:hypothetical protein
MPSSKCDFAPPRWKTLGCFLVIMFGLPAVWAAYWMSPSPLPPWAFPGGMLCSLSGLSALCGNPSCLSSAIKAIGSWGNSGKA